MIETEEKKGQVQLLIGAGAVFVFAGGLLVVGIHSETGLSQSATSKGRIIASLFERS